MNTTTIVAVSGVACAVAFAVASLRRHGADGPLDPQRVEHRLVVHTAGHPRLQQLLRWVDRRVVGGVSVGIGFAALWVAALSIGWILDSIYTAGGFARYDSEIAAWGANHATERSIDVLRVVTQLGDSVVVAVAVAVMFGGRVQRLGDPALEAIGSEAATAQHDERLKR